MNRIVMANARNKVTNFIGNGFIQRKHFKLQKAFVTERAELIDNNRKKWDTSMLQRRDKEVLVESSYTFPITPVLVGNHSNLAMSLHTCTVIWAARVTLY